MIIKQPQSNNALNSLSGSIENVSLRLDNCVNQGHDVITIMYLSSLIISPTVTSNNRRIIEMISDVVSISPRNCICVIRTQSPNHFPGYMQTIHRNSINFLRNNCYIILYTRSQFLNHAKFFLYYHVCLSENIVHYGRYFGSTNITATGLSNPRNRGNYEEYTDYKNIKYRLNHNDKSYLNEVYDIIIHKQSLFTDHDYLVKYVKDHQALLEAVVLSGESVTSDSTSSEIYQEYLHTQMLLNQSYAFLDELPGKKITDNMVRNIASIKASPNPFEIELMTINNEQTNMMIEMLDLRVDFIYRLLNENLNALAQINNNISEQYNPYIEVILNYMDDVESSFHSFLREYNVSHQEYLKKII